MMYTTMICPKAVPITSPDFFVRDTGMDQSSILAVITVALAVLCEF